MNLRLVLLSSILALLLVSACAPPEPPAASQPAVMTPETESSKSNPDAEQAAQDVAAEALGVAPEDVTVLEIESREYPDASLGCPQPDMMYAQMLTSGYQATVEVDGETYDLRMDTKGNGFICPPEK